MVASLDMRFTFQPLFELGRGGVAVVRAERMIPAEGPSQVVAVKRLLPMVAESADTRAMFLDEARLAALIEHPNVVRILHYGEDKEPYIAMELVLGETLSTLIGRARSREEPPLAPKLALHLVAQLCDALGAAHALRNPDTGELLHLVHRDVSPQNVLVGFDGSVRLTDFGIAKALGYGARTRTGDVKGKVPYMSPEQAVADPVDLRSDLYAVAAVWFECLCGRRMLGDGNEIDMLRRLATEAPPPLEHAWPEAPAGAHQLFARLVARDPKQRPASAHDVAHALRALIGDDPPERLKEALAGRMSGLAPRKREDLLVRLTEAEREALRQEPYLDELEAFVDRPSVLFRERRRARIMLAVGVSFLLAAVAFAVAFLRLHRQDELPSTVITSAPAAPSPEPGLLTQASAPVRASAPPLAPPSASSPPSHSPRIAPSKSAPQRGTHDGLDENPF